MNEKNFILRFNFEHFKKPLFLVRSIKVFFVLFTLEMISVVQKKANFAIIEVFKPYF